jgi:hypothetical protein
MTIDVVFLDSGREPQCKPDPNFPEGKLVNLAPHALAKTCARNLPYPAPRCGSYIITCKKCGYRAAITVAGRPDDPNAIQMPCQSGGLDA